MVVTMLNKRIDTEHPKDDSQWLGFIYLFIYILETWNFVIFFSRPGKCLEFAQKVVKTWNFSSKP